MTETIHRRCGCAQCRIRRLMGPVIVITVGVIFLLQQWTPYGMATLWPLLIIVPGVIQVLAYTVSDEGHISS